MRVDWQGATRSCPGRSSPTGGRRAVIPRGCSGAFANIYAEVAQERMARTLGEDVPALPYPRIEDGAHTMAFIEACLASQASGGWTRVAPLPAG